jgi:hypothetical protein
MDVGSMNGAVERSVLVSSRYDGDLTGYGAVQSTAFEVASKPQAAVSLARHRRPRPSVDTAWQITTGRYC